MRFLRIPIEESVAKKMPVWIIDGIQHEEEERREAPRLQIPMPEYPQTQEPPREEEAPRSTVIVIDI